MHLLDRLMSDASGLNRFDLDINVPANPDGTANIIPVDYVAKAAIKIVENPANHRGIYHLTHPDGKRVSLVFTMGAEDVELFAGEDMALTGSLSIQANTEPTASRDETRR